jgi:hypothetical protein
VREPEASVGSGAARAPGIAPACCVTADHRHPVRSA